MKYRIPENHLSGESATYLFAIRLLLADLRRHVIRRTDHGLRERHARLQRSSNSKVTNLDNIVLLIRTLYSVSVSGKVTYSSEEDVLRFDVAMQDLSLVRVLNCQQYLRKPENEQCGVRLH